MREPMAVRCACEAKKKEDALPAVKMKSANLSQAQAV